MKLKIIMGCLFLAIPMACFCQKKGFPIRILAGNEATAIPLKELWTSPSHLTVQLGSEFSHNSHKSHYLYQTINVGYILHEQLFQGGYINSEIGYDYRLGFGLNLKGLIGLGYLHTFSTEEEYIFKEGKYESATDSGNSRMMPSLAAGMGFRTNANNPKSPEILILYKAWVELPYSPGFISIMSHTDISLGIKFFIH
ncbi:hypothetical protein [Flagellimonas oceanensis]|uniref:hypothetical protein n=1 Tax=Flagellimonas oceanensis TaxID=2499163 RepID=UPI000F8E42F2|nr:hypothetical protein [Allomuricauda oceanensis]|tara:strand:+ start:20709 stop:21299 length:591 start_codon:yes stop_codon:yes gene_type:complete